MALRVLAAAALAHTAAATCEVTEELGCFFDAATARLLPLQAVFAGSPTAGAMTRELCAEYCCGAGYADPPGYPPPGSAVVGVEYGAQCYCGKTFDASKAKPPHAPGSNCTMKCSGNSSQLCGGSDAINVFRAKCATSPPCRKPPKGPPGPPPAPPPIPGPTFHGCMDNVSKALPCACHSDSPTPRADHDDTPPSADSTASTLLC